MDDLSKRWPSLAKMIGEEIRSRWYTKEVEKIVNEEK